MYDNGQIDKGAAFIYYGSPIGITTTAAIMVQNTQADSLFGWSVSGAGDVNGDGYSDVIVGSPFYSNGQGLEGAFLVYHGSASGINTPVATLVESNQAGAQLGRSVSGAGDVNGDGYSDVIAGAYLYTNGQALEGAAFIHYGSAGGTSLTAVAMLESNQAGAGFGYYVSGAGDVNGDGYSDVIAGAYLYDNGQNNEGAAFVYHGSAGGINPTAVAMVESNQPDATLGSSVSAAGDVNGDGYSDIIVGAPAYDNGENDEDAAFVYQGSVSGISTTASVTVESNQAGANLGLSVSGAGDMNGDGYSDVIVGAPFYDNGQTDEGGAFVYYGSTNGIGTMATAGLETNQAGAQFGYSVSGAGDVNGDGYSDLIAGASDYDNGQTDEGVAFVYHGSAGSISTTAVALLESNQMNALFGSSVSAAGDINGDGYNDVIVGAYRYDNGQTDEGATFVYYGSATGINTTVGAILESNQAGAYLGWSVSGAGDVNGDGYSDVIAGAYAYNNGHFQEGAVFLYHGSANGINTTAVAILESNQFNALLGWSVSGAGDVNGDGYGDVIVGAPNYNNGQTEEGAAFVYHGSATGISTTAVALLENNQANAYLGWSVSGAGDVNGDGYNDVIVGAYLFDNGQTNEGAAFVYHGSAGSISTTATSRIEGNQGGALLGYSVSGAGDVNGDGYSDVVIGASSYDNGQTDEGAAFVHHGSATGISTTAAALLQSDQVGAALGFSVSGAGDVNGDGYSDVVIGAHVYDNGQTNEGATFVYHGSAGSISATPAAMVESNQAGSEFGRSVSGAGDVNGDGYSDIIIGANRYDNGHADEGAAFVYLGNAGSGLHRNLSLYNSSTSTPIQRSNILVNDFAISLYSKNPDGRTSGKLVWESRSQGQPFSNMPLTNSTQSTAQQAVYTNLGTTGLPLTANVTKPGFANNVRVRIKYNPATSLNGEVYSPWVYVQGPFRPLAEASILPLNLLSFTGRAITQNSALLSWRTSNEISTSRFEVQRSRDGHSFITIATLQAKGTPQGLADYSCGDKDLQPGLYYYRLRILDKDGKENYSVVIPVQFKANSSISVYPVPATDFIWLRNTGNSLIGKSIHLIDMEGRILQTIRITTMPQQINISMLAAGTYLLKLPDETVVKVMKQ